MNSYQENKMEPKYWSIVGKMVGENLEVNSLPF